MRPRGTSPRTAPPAGGRRWTRRGSRGPLPPPLLLLCALALLACQSDRLSRPAGGANLHLRVEWRGWPGEAAASRSDGASSRGGAAPSGLDAALSGLNAAPSGLDAARTVEPRALRISRIDLQIHRTIAGAESLLTTAAAEIASGQTQFRFDVDVPVGDSTSVEIGAFGSDVPAGKRAARGLRDLVRGRTSGAGDAPEDKAVEPGFLFFGRTTDIEVGETEQTVTVVLEPYFPAELQADGSLVRGSSLGWRLVPGAERYRVRARAPGGAESETTVTETAVFFPPQSPPVPERLVFRVRAENRFFIGAFSDSAGVPRAVAPAAPSFVTATPRPAGDALVAWQDNSFDEDRFRIERAGPTGADFDSIGSAAANAESFLDPGPLVPGGTFRYAVRAFQGDQSSVAVASPPFTLPPSPPAALFVSTISAEALRLDWEPPAEGLFDQFVVERQQPGGDFNEIALVPGAVRTIRDSGLASRTTFTYRVRSISNAVRSAQAAGASGRTLPPAPFNLTGTLTEQRTALLSWSYPPPPPLAFLVYRRDAGGDFARIDSLAGTVQQYEDARVLSLHTYEYTLRAREGFEVSAFAETVSVAIPEPPPGPPPAPTNLQATAVSTSKIELFWEDNAIDETAYTVERQGPQDPDFAAVAQLAPDAQTYSDTGLAPRTSYNYRVRVTSPGGNTLSNTAADRTFPPAPESLVRTGADGSSLSFAWTYPGADPEQFVPEIKLHDAPDWSLLDPLDGSLRATTVGELLERQLYDFRLLASEQGDVSAFSNEITAATAPPAPDWISAQFVSESGTILLEWSFALQPDPEHFEVERRKLPEPDFAPLSFNPIPGDARVAEDAAVDLDATYEYRIRAFDLAGTPPDSVASGFAYIQASTPGLVPEPPADLVAGAISTSEITLGWTDASTNESAFLLERRGPADPDFLQIAELPANTQSYPDTGLVERTTYEYRVRARGIGGDSDYSNIASDRTWPPAPTDVYLAAADSTRLTFAWSFPDPLPDQFLPESRRQGSSFWSELAPVAERQALLEGMQPRQTHEFRVRAEEAGDFSDYSGIATGSTLPRAPLWVLAEYQSAGGYIYLQWDYPFVDPDYFEIERRTLPDSVWTAYAGNPIDGSTPSATDSGIVGGTTYEYRIHAVAVLVGDQGTVASVWSHVQAQTPDPPGVPTNVAAERFGGAILVSWANGGGSPTLTYEIFRKRMQDADYSYYSSTTGSDTDFLDTNVGPARTYSYKIRAYGDGGYSDLSTSASATTPGWRRIATEWNSSRPSTRDGPAGALVPSPSRIYLYGGSIPDKAVSDMWVYGIADSTWAQIIYGGSPGPRYNASMAYSPSYQRLYLVGGSTNPDTSGPWYYYLGQNVWTQPCGGDEPWPIGRRSPRAVWMSSLGTFLSIGGYYNYPSQVFVSTPRNHEPGQDSCYTIDDDDPTGGRSGHLMLPISGDWALVYGGLDYDGPRSDSAIIRWSGFSWAWTNFTPTSSPGSRYEADAAINASNGTVYLLGGYDSDFVRRNDLWKVNAPWTDWVQLDPGGSVSVRPDATEGTLVVDPATGYLYHLGPGSVSLEVWLYIP